MNIVTYKGQKYRIIHSLNTTTTYCSVVMATEASASDIASALAHRRDLRSLYRLIPEPIGSYELICNTYRIQNNKGELLGYWDFPLPREHCLYKDGTSDFTHSNREAHFLEFLLGQAEALLANKMPKTHALINGQEKCIKGLTKQQDVQGLELQFCCDYKPTHFIQHMEQLVPIEIKVDEFSAPRITGIKKDTLELEGIELRQKRGIMPELAKYDASFSQSPGLNEIYDNGQDQAASKGISYDTGLRKSDKGIVLTPHGVSALFKGINIVLGRKRRSVNMAKGMEALKEYVTNISRKYIPRTINIQGISEILSLLHKRAALEKEGVLSGIHAILQALPYIESTEPADSVEYTDAELNAMGDPEPLSEDMTNELSREMFSMGDIFSDGESWE